MSKRMGLLCLVLLWAALIALSFLLPARIEGPRNIDTGFQRLDVFARFQFFAFGVAVLALCLGVLWRRSARFVALIGVLPVIATGLGVAAVVVFAMLSNPTPPASSTPPGPAAEAPPALN